MPPTAGRIVHYHADHTRWGGELVTRTWPALVVSWGDEAWNLNLLVFTEAGFFHVADVGQCPTDSPAAYCWSWPPRAA
jgi:hypothetical protein